MGGERSSCSASLRLILLKYHLGESRGQSELGQIPSRGRVQWCCTCCAQSKNKHHSDCTRAALFHCSHRHSMHFITAFQLQMLSLCFVGMLSRRCLSSLSKQSAHSHMPQDPNNSYFQFILCMHQGKAIGCFIFAPCSKLGSSFSFPF